jgi:hypothetical protein
MSEVDRIAAFKKISDYLRGKTIEDDELRERLKRDPKGTIKEEVGVEIPADVEVAVVEDTPTHFHLILPAKPTGELSDEDLAAVAGGYQPPDQQGDVQTGPQLPGSGPPASFRFIRM